MRKKVYVCVCVYIYICLYIHVYIYTYIYIYVSWMIAFITCNSNLVPLLEGLCSSNPCRINTGCLEFLPETNRRPWD